MAAALHRIDAPEVLVGGKMLAERTFGEQAIEGRRASVKRRAGRALPSPSCSSCGGLVAGSLPLVAALATVAATLLALTGLAAAVPVSEYAVNVVTLLGLGLAVDYSLLVLARFREERAADRKAAVPELLARTVATAGPGGARVRPRRRRALAGLFAFAEPLLPRWPWAAHWSSDLPRSPV